MAYLYIKRIKTDHSIALAGMLSFLFVFEEQDTKDSRSVLVFLPYEYTQAQIDERIFLLTTQINNGEL
jgi:hypothetical protein